jgi:F-type H+-transporting ATPase subunit b
MRRPLAVAATLFATLAVAGPLLAAEAEHAAGAADTWLGLPRTLILLVNLAIFLGLIGWLAGPAVVKFLEDKQREVQHALADAARQREEAAQMEARLATQIAELRREVDEIAERAKREGEREKQEILADAERERQRLTQQAKSEVEQGLQHARQELTAHAARLAAGLAEQRLAGGLTSDDRKRLFRDNLARLERRP